MSPGGAEGGGGGGSTSREQESTLKGQWREMIVLPVFSRYYDAKKVINLYFWVRNWLIVNGHRRIILRRLFSLRVFGG